MGKSSTGVRDVGSIRPGNKGLVSSIFDGFHAGTVPVSGSTGGAYEACIADSLSDSLDLFINWNIDRIPACISKLVNLEYLYLTGNRISRIEGLDKLVNLEVLGLNGNQLEPDECEKAKKIVEKRKRGGIVSC